MVDGARVNLQPGGMSELLLSRGQSGITYQHQNQQLAAEQYRHETGWAAAALRVISRRVSAQPARVARRIKPGNKGGRTAAKEFVPPFLKSLANDPGLELVEDHPLLDAIMRPNPIMIHANLMAATVVSIELTGRCFWWITPDPEDDSRIQIWPVPSNWVRPVHEGKLFSGWKVRADGSFKEWDVPASQMIWFRYIDAGNPLGSRGTLQNQGRAVVADEQIAEAQRRAFQNGVWPGLAVVVGRLPGAGGMAGSGQRAVLTDTQRDDILDAFKKRFRGTYRYDEPMILDGFIEDVKKVTASNKEMDFLKSSESTQKRVLGGFGTPEASMGLLENANKASTAASDEILCKNVVNPILSLIGETITAWMAPFYETPSEATVFYIEPATAADPDFELNKTTTLTAGGIMLLNEARQREGLPRIKGGDCLVLNGQLIPATEEGKPGPDLVMPEPLPEPDFQDGDGEQAAVSEPPVEEEAKWFLAKRPAYYRAATVLTRQVILDEWLKRHSKEEDQFARQVGAVLLGESRLSARQVRSMFGSNVMTGTAEKIAGRVFSVPKAHKRMMAAVRPNVRRIAYRGALAEWDLHRPRRSTMDARVAAADWVEKRDDSAIEAVRQRLPASVRSRVDEEIAGILDRPFMLDLSETTRERIVTSLQHGLERGLTGDEMAEELEDIVGFAGGLSRGRAIARTETTRASNAGAEESRKELVDAGLVTGKTWLSIIDKDTRETHVEANDQTVKADEKFKVGDEEADYPGDPELSAEESINCRCTTISETVELPEEEGKAAVFRLWQKCGGPGGTPGPCPEGGKPEPAGDKPAGDSKPAAGGDGKPLGQDGVKSLAYRAGKAAQKTIDAVKEKIDQITNVPVLAQIKGGLRFVKGLSTKLHGKLAERYGGKTATAIMASGTVADFAILGAAKFTFPGASLVLSLPAVGVAEAFRQGRRLLGKDMEDPANWSEQELVDAFKAEVWKPLSEKYVAWMEEKREAMEEAFAEMESPPKSTALVTTSPAGEGNIVADDPELQLLGLAQMSLAGIQDSARARDQYMDLAEKTINGMVEVAKVRRSHPGAVVVQVNPTPVKAGDVHVYPAQVNVNPTPVSVLNEVKPTPVEVRAGDVHVHPANVNVNPTPVEVNNAPANVEFRAGDVHVPVPAVPKPQGFRTIVREFNADGVPCVIDKIPIPLEEESVHTSGQA